MNNQKVFRMRASVALVYKNGKLDIFRTNTREQFIIKIDYENITSLIFSFDGKKTIQDISIEYPDIDFKELCDLVSFLNERLVLIEVDIEYDERVLEEKYRVINLLEDFCISTSEVVSSLAQLETKSVMIVGLGAVGTWIVDALARTGLKNFILVDDDKVELSNLHRQDLFFEEDIGKFKVDCIDEKLQEIDDINVIKIKSKLEENFFSKVDVNYDLIINCADFPSVDVTTEIIAKESMRRKVPHIVGGGYNLHLTLIGQTVIPHETACVKCFQTHLEKINNADLDGVKKLARNNRKIGSFGPLCSLSASITSLDAIKVLINKYQTLTNKNKRIEFIINERDIKKHDVIKNPNCSWCGKDGEFALSEAV